MDKNGLTRRAAGRLLTGAAVGGAALTMASEARADVLADVKQRGTLTCATEMQFAPFDFLVNANTRACART